MVVVTNEDEKTDGTDPLDPGDYVQPMFTLAQKRGDYFDGRLVMVTEYQ